MKGLTPSKQASLEEKARSENDSDDYGDEYRDMVFDFDHSKALVRVADDYLEGREAPLLALPAPGDELNEDLLSAQGADDTKSLGGASGMSKLSDRNFIQINKAAQAKVKPFLRT